MKVKSTNQKQKLVTVIGTNYVEEIVPELLEKSFDIYTKKDFSKRHFQVSVHENTFSTSSIVLSVLGIEAYRNRIYYLDKKRVGKNVARDISEVFFGKDSNFPKHELETILNEVFVVRDVIVHNHIYEVEVVSDENWDMVSHRQKLLEGYGDDKKFKTYVNNRTRKTKYLGLNVQPGKIGFEDLFKVLIIFDLFVGIAEKLLTGSYVPFHFVRKVNGGWNNKIWIYLSGFYNRIPNPVYKTSLRKLLDNINVRFKKFAPDFSDCFLSNYCPQCKDYGFRQPGKISKCNSCGFEIKLIIKS